jgi:hypothetical protein
LCFSTKSFIISALKSASRPWLPAPGAWPFWDRFSPSFWVLGSGIFPLLSHSWLAEAKKAAPGWLETKGSAALFWRYEN